MFLLVEAVQQLSLARDLPTIQAIVRRAARALTGADGATFVLRDADKCHYADEDAIAPLWKGMRFPLETCISGWAMLNRSQAVIPDIYLDARIPHVAYRPTFVKSLVMVPIRTLDPVGAIGNYWAQPHQATAEEVHLLQALADSTAVAMENVRVYAELEERVVQRTRQLEEASEEIRQLSLVDELTGLHNRRGFLLLAEQSRLHARRAGVWQFLAYIDADGLKQVNDRLGHHAGDAYIRSLAGVLRDSFREADVIGRLGGDEFCVLGTLEEGADATAVRARLVDELERFNNHRATTLPRLGASCGVCLCPPDAEDAIARLIEDADHSMYVEKRARSKAA